MSKNQEILAMPSILTVVKAYGLSNSKALLTDNAVGRLWMGRFIIIITWFIFIRCAEFVNSGAELIPSYCNIALIHAADPESATVRARSKI